MSFSILTAARIAFSLGTLLLATTAGFAADAPQKIRIVYASRSSSALPQYMAVQKGYFKEQGLDVEIIQMNPRLGAAAITSGEVAFATPFTSTFRGALRACRLSLFSSILRKVPTM